MKKTFIFSLITFIASFSIAQITNETNTVGLLYTEPEKVSEGLILFAPNESKFAYLIDNCGLVARKWTFETQSAYSNAYLLPDGSVVRIVIQAAPENGNGCIERRSWEDELVWRYCSKEENGFNFHSDLQYLPNGNFLVLSYHTLPAKDAIKAGVNPDVILLNLYYTESVIELSPQGTDDATIVWEWSMLDHLVQDFDSTKLNYGNVKENVRKIDANLSDLGFYHFNSVDYNTALDQVVLSNYTSNEIYIIDHSTTAEEVSGSTGGKYGLGGDLLFRWGNPKNYGAAGKQQLLDQHDPKWIPNSNARFGGKLSLYNNKYGELVDELANDVSGMFVLDIDPDENGIYPLNENGVFLPDEPHYVWTGKYKDLNVYSEIMSGVDVLPNGNLLICEALGGRFTEVDTAGNVIWRYILPDGRYGLIPQGEPAIADVYKIKKYDYGYIPQLNRQLCGTSIIENENELTELCRPYLEPKVINNFSRTYSVQYPEGLTRNFYSISENTDSIVWDFGDGNFSYEANPIHTYAEPGAYFVDFIGYNCYGTDKSCGEVVVYLNTSIDEAELSSLVQIYPVPAQTQLLIKTKTNFVFNNYSIYNLAGKFIKEGSTTENKIAIDFLEDGVYLLQLDNYLNNESTIVNFIKSP